jgi:hypothetical protein
MTKAVDMPSCSRMTWTILRIDHMPTATHDDDGDETLAEFTHLTGLNMQQPVGPPPNNLPCSPPFLRGRCPASLVSGRGRLRLLVRYLRPPFRTARAVFPQAALTESSPSGGSSPPCSGSAARG